VGSNVDVDDGSPRPLNTGKPLEYSGKKYDASECGGMHCTSPLGVVHFAQKVSYLGCERMMSSAALMSNRLSVFNSVVPSLEL
jgi:hypothetical protein